MPIARSSIDAIWSREVLISIYIEMQKKSPLLEETETMMQLLERRGTRIREEQMTSRNRFATRV